jgi:hypothetical protein
LVVVVAAAADLQLMVEMAAVVVVADFQALVAQQAAGVALVARRFLFMLVLLHHQFWIEVAEKAFKVAQGQVFQTYREMLLFSQALELTGLAAAAQVVVQIQVLDGEHRQVVD